MAQRTPEEEAEYRRYLRRRIRMRKRRRQVMIARAIVAAAGILILALFGLGIRKLAASLGGDQGKIAVATAEPTATPFTVEVPEGYEEIYEELYALREDYAEIDDILLNLRNYPLDLLNLIVTDTDTISFVSDYLMHTDDEEANGIITEEDLEGTDVPLFLQWDKRWGYITYGNNLLAISGCGPTCMSMVYTSLTQDLEKSPADMADFCIENNYYTEESGTSWTFMLEGAQKLGLTSEKISVSEETITDRLESGSLIICSMGPGDFTTTGHFIVVYGLTDEGKLLINDPNSMTRSNKEWKFKKVLEQTKAAWAYSYSAE